MYTRYIVDIANFVTLTRLLPLLGHFLPAYLVERYTLMDFLSEFFLSTFFSTPSCPTFPLKLLWLPKILTSYFSKNSQSYQECILMISTPNSLRTKLYIHTRRIWRGFGREVQKTYDKDFHEETSQLVSTTTSPIDIPISSAAGRTTQQKKSDPMQFWAHKFYANDQLSWRRHFLSVHTWDFTQRTNHSQSHTQNSIAFPQHSICVNCM